MKKFRTILILAALAMIPSLTHLGCDGGGDDSGGNRGGESTTINGIVSHVVAMNESGSDSVKFADIMKMLSPILEARAQNGIPVTAMVNGGIVDTDITDPDGSFTLSFPLESPDNITLLFNVNGTEVSIVIFVQEGSVLEIVVSIDLNASPGDEVEIEDITEAEASIRCETGTVNISTDPGEDLIIDGKGEDCIRAEGNCNFAIDAQNIVLTNCERCVDAKGTSDVLLIANADIFCDAFEDGIRTEGDATLTLESEGDISVLSNENVAKAQGNSSISLFADACIFDSDEDVFDESGNAIIDAEGCGEIIDGPSQALSSSPSLSASLSPSPLASPGPSPEPSPKP